MKVKPNYTAVLDCLSTHSKTVKEIVICSGMTEEWTRTLLRRLESKGLITATSYRKLLRYKLKLNTLSKHPENVIPHCVPDYKDEMDYGTHLRHYTWEEVVHEAMLIGYEENKEINKL